ncbi:YbaB/EbfC family nucleoid-associated protein [Salininema proteolyticum]|uniref:YbaB/EbfC family nucleoid-associated protein n=1 Tax=Salininema proteolyticum TaxID=1607685 RepID=A0ABV8TSE2_9ACTN
MTDRAKPVPIDPVSLLERMQETQRNLTERLEALEIVKGGLERLETTVTDDGGALSVTVSGGGEIRSLDIEPSALDMREALGPLMVATIARAQDRHHRRMRDMGGGFGFNEGGE